MGRRSDPDRIATAREAALRARLRSTGVLPAKIDTLLEQWAFEAAARGLDPREQIYWEKAVAWLSERLR